MKKPPVKILGLEFFSGSAQEAISEILNGGLLVAPAAPGLAHNLINDPNYREALQNAKICLPDSGLMVLLWNRVKPNGSLTIPRVSGLEFLKKFLISPTTSSHIRESFWVMPSEEESQLNQKWLAENLKIKPNPDNIYIAPQYPGSGDIQDRVLLDKIKATDPKLVAINVGGGTQERLGNYLQKNLPSNPAILCCGAAIAFLSGGQTSIPNWADKLKLGWLLRCISKPGSYIPRYWHARSLVPLMYRYKEQLPPLKVS